MSPVKKSSKLSRAESIAFCGLSIALLTVSAWVTVPLGPVPFTLQTMMLVFVVLLFPPREALASVFGYLALGALGAPVFSGMKGGMASLLGPTGGFIIGFGLGAVAAVLILKVWKSSAARGVAARRSASADAGDKGTSFAAPPVRNTSRFVFALGMAREYTAALALLIVSYACGWAQLMAVAGMSPLAAFLAGIAPFIVLDVIKIVVGASLAHAIRNAVPALRTKVA